MYTIVIEPDSSRTVGFRKNVGWSAQDATTTYANFIMANCDFAASNGYTGRVARSIAGSARHMRIIFGIGFLKNS